MPKPKHLRFLLFFLLLLLFLHHTTSLHPDLTPLLDFKSIADPSSTALSLWSSSTSPCTWPGVSCYQNRVTRLVLENLNLQNTFSPLTSLTYLRVLSLKYNNFTQPIPDFSKLSSLKLLFLSHNHLSGPFPTSLTSLSHLYRLDLSFNNLSGPLPTSLLNHLTHLLTLRLEENDLSGPISTLSLPNIQDFNISGNAFTGEIPVSLSHFPESSFWSNSGFLCGVPLKYNCSSSNGGGVVPSDPTQPGSGNGAKASPVSPSVASSPSELPLDNDNNGTKLPVNRMNRREKGEKIGTLAIVAIILGDVLALCLISLLLYCYFWRKNREFKVGSGKGSNLAEGEKIVYSSSPYYGNGGGGGFERGKMVFFEGARRFELEDLLRASAEMLGKGGFGTAYKAVLDDGNVVAVKRLKDLNVGGNGGNGGGKREFEQQMEVLGRLRHPNLVGLKAYYFARDEKLLVYEYMPNGNLFWLLHGNRGPGRTPLDWTTRLKIAAGAAHGLAYIHSSCKTLKLTHGNIKSTNILIDKAGNARVSDFGLAIFASSSSFSKSNGYRAPEVALDGRKLTQKSDVYSFGVLLLELLTGKCPSIVDNGGTGTGYAGVVDLPRWVQSVVREEWTAEVFDLELMRYKDIEEEMVGLLQIAMACTSASPDQRPKMNYVVKMIEELRGVEVSPSHDAVDSVSDSPSASEDASCIASQ